MISPIDIDCPAPGCGARVGFACNNRAEPGVSPMASFHNQRRDKVMRNSKQRVTGDEYQVKVGDYVKFPVADANIGWHIVYAVRDEQDRTGVTAAPVRLQKRRCYPWKDLQG